MRFSRLLAPTLRETPRDVEVRNQEMLLRAGFIRQMANGLYVFLPLGFRTLKKVMDIVREEMDKAGALEMLPPFVTPAELWEMSGRLNAMGKEMVRFEDRRGNTLVLGPTHEEAFTWVVKNEVKSYKDLPLTLYQIAIKFRDEIRPRFGIMRCREFIMKDAYSFDVDEEGLKKSYEAIRKAYINIFKRVGLNTVIVEADVGAMGGYKSEEFMVPADIGEETIISCPKCGYSANVEKAECKRDDTEPDTDETPLPLETIDTPDTRTIEELEKFFGVPAAKFLKTLIYVADGEPVAVVVRGDVEVNETKLKNALGVSELSLAEPDVIEKVTGAPVGFAGPVGLKGVKIIADLSVKSVINGITGANEKDKHIKNVNLNRDYDVDEFYDLKRVVEGDKCPKCGSPLKESRGIEVGHIFMLGTKYTESMEVFFLDRDGKRKHPIMGCYGIGVGRTMAAVVEVSNDDKGIIWPITIAPYEVLVLPVNVKDEKVMETAEHIYSALKEGGIDVIIDDRDETPGVKFNDADLIGFPIRVVIGKALKDGKVEVSLRREPKNRMLFDVDDVLKKVVWFVREEFKRYSV